LIPSVARQASTLGPILFNSDRLLEHTVMALESEIRRRVPEVKKVSIEAEAWRRLKLRKELL